MKKIPLFLLFLLFSLAGQARTRILFDADWLFVLGDDSTMASPSYDDRGWRRLSLPHDWAIEGDFHVGNPSGASGGALPGGVGWYRKHFRLPAGSSDDRVLVTFDGVYMNATVYVNGHALGTRPYGYSTFEYDLTPYLTGRERTSWPSVSIIATSPTVVGILAAASIVMCGSPLPRPCAWPSGASTPWPSGARATPGR